MINQRRNKESNHDCVYIGDRLVLDAEVVSLRVAFVKGVH